MLTTQKDREEEAAGTFECPSTPSVTFQDGSHPVDLYVKGDNGKRADVLLNHQDVIGFIYVHENIVSKAFVVKRNTDFGTNVRTVTAVSGNYYHFTPFRVADKIFFSDFIMFNHTRSDDPFPSIQVGLFLSQSVNLAGKGLYPKLPGDLKKIRSIAWLTRSPWILPLVRGPYR